MTYQEGNTRVIIYQHHRHFLIFFACSLPGNFFPCGAMNEVVLEKLKVLAESAKYDVSCSSSGTVRKNKAGSLGNTVGGMGICHSF